MAEQKENKSGWSPRAKGVRARSAEQAEVKGQGTTRQGESLYLYLENNGKPFTGI